MHLKRDHIRSLLNSSCHQNNVELREHSRIVDFKRLRIGIELISQVEASHLVTVEIHHHSSCILHTHIQHLIVINVGQLEALADVRRHPSGIRNISCLLRLPRSIVERSRVPSSRSLSTLIHLPLCVFNLEREER